MSEIESVDVAGFLDIFGFCPRCCCLQLGYKCFYRRDRRFEGLKVLLSLARHVGVVIVLVVGDFGDFFLGALCGIFPPRSREASIINLHSTIL